MINIVTIFEPQDSFLKSLTQEQILGVSQTTCMLGDQQNFLENPLESFHLYFLSVVIPESNTLRVICLNNLTYFDVNNLSKYNFLQFEDVLTYTKEKFVIYLKNQILQAKKPAKVFSLIKDINHPLWSLFFEFAKNKLNTLFLMEFKDWLETVKKSESFPLSGVQGIDPKTLTIMTQHLLDYHGYFHHMFNFTTSIYDEPEANQLKLPNYWPKG